MSERRARPPAPSASPPSAEEAGLRAPRPSTGTGRGEPVGPRLTVMNRQRRLALDGAWLRRELTRVAREENLGRSALSVVLVSDRRLRELNRLFHGRAEVTDVLTFDYGPAAGEDDIEGEVVVSAERALAESEARGLPPEGELLLYCIHGLLHLAGYEDSTPARGARMWRRQLAHLERAGFPARLWQDGPRRTAPPGGSGRGPSRRRTGSKR
jgi:probable rRNA maturation factor